MLVGHVDVTARIDEQVLHLGYDAGGASTVADRRRSDATGIGARGA
jgi:hypothetical protein